MSESKTHSGFQPDGRPRHRDVAMLRAILTDYQGVISGPDVQRGMDACANLTNTVEQYEALSQEWRDMKDELLASEAALSRTKEQFEAMRDERDSWRETADVLADREAMVALFEAEKADRHTFHVALWRIANASSEEMSEQARRQLAWETLESAGWSTAPEPPESGDPLVERDRGRAGGSNPASSRAFSVEITGDGSGVALPPIESAPVDTPRVSPPFGAAASSEREAGADTSNQEGEPK